MNLIIYILDNGHQCIADALKINYSGKDYELTERPMDGSLYFVPDGETEERTVVGVVEEYNGYKVEIYAADEAEYDTIYEVLSASEEEIYPAYYCFNDRVFFKDPQPQIEGRFDYWIYIEEDHKIGFETLADAEAWAATGENKEIQKIITLYANGGEVNYYSCIVSDRTFNRLTSLSTLGGFKRFTIDYEDDTNKKETDLSLVYQYFLSKVFPNTTKENVLHELN